MELDVLYVLMEFWNHIDTLSSSNSHFVIEVGAVIFQEHTKIHCVAI